MASESYSHVLAQVREAYRKMSRAAIVVNKDHPLWRAWDDDDWNGATAANWVTAYAKPDERICLTPPDDVSAELLGRMCLALVGRGVIVSVTKA
jgi:hypothetical protein